MFLLYTHYMSKDDFNRWRYGHVKKLKLKNLDSFPFKISELQTNFKCRELIYVLKKDSDFYMFVTFFNSKSGYRVKLDFYKDTEV